MSKSIISESENSEESENNNNTLFGLTEIKIKEKEKYLKNEIQQTSIQSKLISMVLFILSYPFLFFSFVLFVCFLFV